MSKVLNAEIYAGAHAGLKPRAVPLTRGPHTCRSGERTVVFRSRNRGAGPVVLPHLLQTKGDFECVSTLFATLIAATIAPTLPLMAPAAAQGVREANREYREESATRSAIIATTCATRTLREDVRNARENYRDDVRDARQDRRADVRDWRQYRNYDYNRFERGQRTYYADRYYRDGRYYQPRRLTRATIASIAVATANIIAVATTGRPA